MTGPRISDMTAAVPTVDAWFPFIEIVGGVPTIANYRGQTGAIFPASVPAYRASGAASDTAAFLLALATGRPIYFPAGQGSGATGEYLITTAVSATYVGYLTAGTHIFGDGRGETIIRPVAAGDLVFRILSASAATTIANVQVNDLTLYGRVEDSAFSEHVHLIHANGVEGLSIERVEFKGFQGDGLYIGSGETAGDERHNSNVTVRDCIFDGVNNDNRAGISVIDWNGILIDNCKFINCTKSTMPGAIDFEPDANAFAVCKDATVRDCTFEAGGGNVAKISLLVPSAVTASPTGFSVLNNTFLSGVGANDIAINTNRTVAATGTHSGVVIKGNYGKSGVTPFYIVGVRGVLVEGNTFDTYTIYGALGFNGSTDLLRDCKFLNNTMILVGTDATLPGALVSKVNGLEIRGNTFDRCGAASTSGRAIGFHDVAVTSDRVSIEDNEVITAASQTAAVTVGGSHTLTPANNRKRNNAYGSLTDAFLATAPGQVLNPVTATYDPGSLATAASTTIQTMTVTGAALGDTVKLSFSNSLAGAVLSAWVSATDTVSYFFTNTNGANPLDLASGTVTAIVTKKEA